jgi:hypothetical protein
MAIEFEAKVTIATEFGSLRDGESVRGYIRMRSAAVTSDKWLNTIDRGLGEFVVSLQSELAEAALAEASRPDVAAPPPYSGEIEEWFRSCMHLTDRTKNECFDACR